MKSYTLEYSKTLTQVLFLVLYPILACVLFFGAIILFGDFFTQDELIMPSVIAFLVLLLGSSIFIVKRYITIPATLAFDENGITLKLDKRNMFYSFNQIVCGWDNVKNVSGSFDDRTKRHFLMLSFKNPGGASMLITSNKENDGQIDDIWNEMNTHINNYNKQATVESKITKRGFYAGPLMRLLAYAGICMIVAFGVMLLYAPSFRTTENILKLVALLAFLIPFLLNYFKSRKSEDEQLTK